MAFLALLLIVTALGLLVVGLAGASSALIATSMALSLIALISMMLVRVRLRLSASRERSRPLPIGSTSTAKRIAESEPVWVIPGRALYHRQSCAFIAGRDAVPLSGSHAARDGYDPCALCDPASG
ncbi:MAG: hypothetical protein JWN95_3037 [Frankiales bacterium]|nr:hypothetical protein [Frankiales bacterium]